MNAKKTLGSSLAFYPSLLTISTLCITFVAFTACASLETQQKHYAQTTPLVEKGNYNKASSIIENAKGDFYQEKDAVLYYLDIGMLYHWAGRYEESNTMLDLAENRIEELYTERISKKILSGILNDNSLDYAGEEYEDIYLNVFKALNYIALQKQESALVEIRRANIKLNLLEDKYRQFTDIHNESAETQIDYPENTLHNSALARYISAILYRNESSIDDARIDIKLINQAWSTQKNIYNFPKPPLPSMESTDKARVNVLCFSGLSPIKLSETIYFGTDTDSVYIADSSQNSDYSENLSNLNFMIVPGITPIGYLKMDFPRMENRSSKVNRVVINLDGEKMFRIPLFEDMQMVAQTTFDAKKDLIAAKTIIRATLKFIAGQAGQEAIRSGFSNEKDSAGEFLGLLFGILSDVAMHVTENADLRISHFFPSHAWAAEFTVEPGFYEVTMEYWNNHQLLSSVNHGRMEFKTGELNFIESFMLK